MAAEDWARGKVVAVTGGAGGLGAAFGRRFAAAGARVAVLDLERTKPQVLAAALAQGGAEAVGLVCDVTDPGQCQEAMAELVRRWGGVDILINNAGITHRSAFAQTTLAVQRRVMEVNYFGSLNCTQAALSSLIARRGLIVVISSVAGFAPLFGRTGYAASKHALHGLFASLRCELAGSGVGVSIVCPSFADTAIAKNALDGDGRVTSHPQSKVGRVASPDEVAEAVFRAAAKRRPLTVLSPIGRLSWWFTRLLPNLYEKLMTRSLRSELER
ncbi:MAG: SDR family oxidoreductase [Thermodesulfobacteriota bacterium]